MENISDYWKKYSKKYIFYKTFLLSFHLSAFEVIFIKTFDPALCWQNEFVCSLKIEHKRRSLIDSFLTNHCSLFCYSRSFSCNLYLDDSSRQVSYEKLQR